MPTGTRAEGTFLAKSPGVVAGLAVADLVFQIVDPAIEVGVCAPEGGRGVQVSGKLVSSHWVAYMYIYIYIYISGVGGTQQSRVRNTRASVSNAF